MYLCKYIKNYERTIEPIVMDSEFICEYVIKIALVPQWWLRLKQFLNFSPKLHIINFASFNLSRKNSQAYYLLKNGKRYIHICM